mmetsp:Transcript_28859/g.55666  ORF Transcript_28859/g.55666 Transcript_28859/m.55666 type:complete len:627 (+) Transcript_28859:62-1942(+)|eukprot:CAMPEP_0172775794 /NCGR_PEP_ID=MMETSP1074-20121228/198631_1 /TAXON_ID=2916 /ORGANISM="Ceratium fusus, Strain PA161109" /LENGTH=626 /DNA_ID=CAMNT_0013612461 /DNA_START=16 /DNA_END=1896 /DNA_ORIENTATION=+
MVKKSCLADMFSQGASRARELWWVGWSCRRSCSGLEKKPAWKWPDPQRIQQHPSHLSLGLTLEAMNDFLDAVGWPYEYERIDIVLVSVPPGNSGFELDWETGRITGLVAGSPAEASGLMVGWTLQNIEGEAYNKELLRSYMDGSEPFDATFNALGHWITQDFGPRRICEECGYDLVNHIRDEFRLLNYERFSVAEVMLSMGHPGVRQADKLLSHAQAETVQATLQGVQLCGPDRSVFVDYFCVRHLQETSVSQMAQAITDIGHVVIHLDPVTAWTTRLPSFAAEAPRRLWCLFEALAVLPHPSQAATCSSSPAPLLGVMSLAGYLTMIVSPDSIADFDKAKAHSASDRQALHNYVETISTDYPGRDLHAALIYATDAAELEPLSWVFCFSHTLCAGCLWAMNMSCWVHAESATLALLLSLSVQLVLFMQGMVEIRVSASESWPLMRIYSKLCLAAFPRPACLLLSLIFLVPLVMLEALAGTLLAFCLKLRLGLIGWWLTAMLVLALCPAAALQRGLRSVFGSWGAPSGWLVCIGPLALSQVDCCVLLAMQLFACALLMVVKSALCFVPCMLVVLFMVLLYSYGRQRRDPRARTNKVTGADLASEMTSTPLLVTERTWSRATPSGPG